MRLAWEPSLPGTHDPSHPPLPLKALLEGGIIMARGSKEKYTGKQERKAEHIEEGYKKRGTSSKEAERRAWATVNKESGGGKKSGSGRGKKSNKSSSRKGGRKGGKKKH